MLLRIKDIKEFKLDSAQKELQKVLAKIEKLREEFRTAIQTLEQHVEWRQQVEDQLYASIELNVVKPKKLDEIRENIASMHQQDAMYRQEIMNIESQLEQANSEKKECQLRVNMAEKTLEKFNELIKENDSEQALTRERQSENLLDEFTTSRFFGETCES